jgi:uncharacterized coiled-coil protein SlyX
MTEKTYKVLDLGYKFLALLVVPAVIWAFVLSSKTETHEMRILAVEAQVAAAQATKDTVSILASDVRLLGQRVDATERNLQKLTEKMDRMENLAVETNAMVRELKAVRMDRK